MKKLGPARRAVVAAFLCSTLTVSCGGGGGGGGGGGIGTGTFTRTIEVGAANASFGAMFATNQARYMLLLLASDIGGSGKVTSLRLKHFSALAAGFSCPNTTIRMGATTLATLSATYASNVNQGAGTQATVLNDSTVSIPAGAAGDYFNIDLATPFEYNGRDNLTIEFARASNCTGSAAVSLTAVGYNGTMFDTSSATAVTGTVSTTSALTRLVFSGGDDAIIYPGTGVSNTVPFSTTVSFNHVQNLHFASTLNGSGPITGIGMISNATTVLGTYTVTVKLAHASLGALTTNFASNFDSGAPTTVANGVTFTIPAGVPAGTPIWLPITGAFSYNGTSNLLVDIEVTSPTAINNWRRKDALTANVRLSAAPGAATGIADALPYDTVFRFNGGPITVMTDRGGTTLNVLNLGSQVGRIALYRQSELGSAGTVTSIACRLADAASTATSYANYRVFIGHTSLDSLDTVAANNFISKATAVSGTISVPAGLTQGDWVEIPLATPFAYNGTSNLTVWVGTAGATGAAGTHTCYRSSVDAARFPSHTGIADPTGNAVTVENQKLDMRFMISR